MYMIDMDKEWQMEAIKNLERYIADDRSMRDNKTESDFEWFCEQHCQDIEIVIRSLKEQNKGE